MHNYPQTVGKGWKGGGIKHLWRQRNGGRGSSVYGKVYREGKVSALGKLVETECHIPVDYQCGIFRTQNIKKDSLRDCANFPYGVVNLPSNLFLGDDLGGGIGV